MPFSPMALAPAKEICKTTAQHCLYAFVVSDVHLNNHHYTAGKKLSIAQELPNPSPPENAQRRHFREFLSGLNQRFKNEPTSRPILVLNGDIIDITGSWFSEVYPWDPSPKQVEETLMGILQEIVENNRRIFQELSDFLAHPHSELVFVIGNHDGMLAHFPATQQFLIQQICPESEKRSRIHFVSSLALPELSFYAEHGHQFDFFNRCNTKHPFPIGDYVNIYVVNRFVDCIIDKLEEQHYSQGLVEQLRLELMDVEHLRPFSLIPLWLETKAKHYKNHPENEGKQEPIDQILLSMVAEVLDTQATRSLIEQLHLPRKFLTSLVNWWVHLPGSLPIVSFLVSQAMRRTHSNRYQYKMAQKLHREEGYRFITFGHTHAPNILPLDQEGYYFNTGSWKPVVNLFKTWDFDEANLELLTPNVRFNRVDRSGILSIEKDLSRPDSQPIFSLESKDSSHRPQA